MPAGAGPCRKVDSLVHRANAAVGRSQVLLRVLLLSLGMGMKQEQEQEQE